MEKVLIIIAGLQFGGAERFAVNIAKYAPHGKFQIDYLIFDGLGNEYANEVEQAGGKVISIPSPRDNYIKYIQRLGRIIKDNKYTVVHSQTQFNNGINMLISKRCGVPIRISHSHTTAHEMRVSGKRKLYEVVMRQMINKYSTHRWACGVSAGNWMFGKREFQVIHNGIDIHQFSFSEEKRELIRRQFNLSKDCLVIGHCGKLSKLKKQEFLIRLMPRILKKRKACLLLIGGGDIEYGEYLKKLAVDCGVNEHVNFTGAVTNVQDYLSAFDVFAFPSLREGTPLALIEAQVNGLPCVINDTIPDDAIITDLVKKISIRKAEEWIRFICSEKRDISKHYDDILKSQGYDIRDTNSIIYQTYSNNE